jgi:hypothetical protein
MIIFISSSSVTNILGQFQDDLPLVSNYDENNFDSLSSFNPNELSLSMDRDNNNNNGFEFDFEHGLS